jgi:hypothetical protein
MAERDQPPGATKATLLLTNAGQFFYRIQVEP